MNTSSIAKVIEVSISKELNRPLSLDRLMNCAKLEQLAFSDDTGPIPNF